MTTPPGTEEYRAVYTYDANTSRLVGVIGPGLPASVH
jgi:hypothetical protein